MPDDLSSPNPVIDLSDMLYHMSQDAAYISSLSGGSFSQAYEARDVQNAINDLVEAAKGGDEQQLERGIAYLVQQLQDVSRLTLSQLKDGLSRHSHEPSLQKVIIQAQRIREARILQTAQHMRQDLGQIGYINKPVTPPITPPPPV